MSDILWDLVVVGDVGDDGDDGDDDDKGMVRMSDRSIDK